MELTAVSRYELQLRNNYIDGMVQLCGNAVVVIMEQLTLSIQSKGSFAMDCDGKKCNLKNPMKLASQFMKLFWAYKERTESSHFSVASRFLSKFVNFIGCIQQKEDMVMLMETTNPLLEWISNMHLLDKNINYELQLLWKGILRNFQRKKSSMDFDSSFLKFQEAHLERTLDHPNPAISEPTINFWNSTYGTQKNLDFPQKLFPVLDKLYRRGKIKLCNRNYYVEGITDLQRYKVTTTLNKCSRRVEIMGNPMNGSHDAGNISFCTKRKQPVLTEHQKEVRRAQKGRARDCNGHGPGIRTYTTADFSQGNDES